MKPNKGMITNWAIIPFGRNGHYVVIGDHESGTDIRTSYIVRLDLETNVVETANSQYTLGARA